MVRNYTITPAFMLGVIAIHLALVRTIEMVLNFHWRSFKMLKPLITEEMKKRGMSTRQVAEEMGMSHTTVIRALRGGEVDLTTVIKISEWLGVKPSTLINSLADTKSALPDKIAVMLGGHPRLEAEFAKAIKAILEEKVDPAIIEDIAAYASYRIDLSVSHQ